MKSFLIAVCFILVQSVSFADGSVLVKSETETSTDDKGVITRSHYEWTVDKPVEKRKELVKHRYERSSLITYSLVNKVEAEDKK